jgi:mono/diheme cytochrome c family protein
MEQRVGPLTDADLEQLADFVKDPTANTRLKSAEARLAQMFTAKMEPASPATGHALFFGAKPFANGGMICSSCHAVQGRGGLLGPDLTRVHARMGDTPLVSAIEKASFKVMAPAYRAHPVTKQEALHLARYLGSLDPAAPVAVPPPTGTMGVAGAAAFLGGLAWLKRKKGFGKRPRMERRRK